MNVKGTAKMTDKSTKFLPLLVIKDDDDDSSEDITDVDECASQTQPVATTRMKAGVKEETDDDIRTLPELSTRRLRGRKKINVGRVNSRSVDKPTDKKKKVKTSKKTPRRVAEVEKPGDSLTSHKRGRKKTSEGKEETDDENGALPGLSKKVRGRKNVHVERVNSRSAETPSGKKKEPESAKKTPRPAAKVEKPAGSLTRHKRGRKKTSEGKEETDDENGALPRLSKKVHVERVNSQSAEKPSGKKNEPESAKKTPRPAAEVKEGPSGSLTRAKRGRDETVSLNVEPGGPAGRELPPKVPAPAKRAKNVERSDSQQSKEKLKSKLRSPYLQPWFAGGGAFGREQSIRRKTTTKRCKW